MEWTLTFTAHNNHASNPQYGVVALSAGDDFWNSSSVNKLGIQVYGNGSTRCLLREDYSGSTYTTAEIFVFSLSTPYYMRLIRTGTTLELDIYSDAARTILLSSGVMTLQAVVSYNDIWALMGEHASLASSARSGSVDSLDPVSGFMLFKPKVFII